MAYVPFFLYIFLYKITINLVTFYDRNTKQVKGHCVYVTDLHWIEAVYSRQYLTITKAAA